MSIKKSLKKTAIAYSFICAAIVLALLLVRGGKQFNYEHRDQVQRDGYVSAPAVDRYHVSTSVAWDATNNGAAAAFKIFGLVLLCAYYIVIFAAATNAVEFPKSTFNIASWVIIAAVLACLFGAYSGTYANNWIDVTPAQQEAIKANPKVIEDLFKAKELIK